MDEPKSINEALQERAPHISPQRIAKTLYAQRKDSAAAAARQAVAYRLLGAFDSFCSEHGIEYFAIANTLVGATVYGDFIPGSSMVELGMRRSEYLKLEEAYNDAGGVDGALLVSLLSNNAEGLEEELYETISEGESAEVELGNPDAQEAPEGSGLDADGTLFSLDADVTSDLYESKDEVVKEIPQEDEEETTQRNRPNLPEMVVTEDENVIYHTLSKYPHEFTLVTHKQPGHRHRALSPKVRLAGYAVAKSGGETLYSNDHMPMRINQALTISVFDEVPDDYDAARFLFWRVKAVARASRTMSKKLPTVLRGKALEASDDARWELAGSYNGRGCLESARIVPSRSRSIPVADISPTRRMPFGPVSVMVPADSRTWVNEDRACQDAQVARLQADALEIVAEIDRICRANDIGYFVCGGTMLGLVRHGGFIPWDDDMDVGMLRADYERFLEVAPSQIDSERFFLQTRESDPKIPYLFAKVRMNDSEYVTAYNRFRDFHKGICVDLFPFDRVPFEYGGLPAFRDSLKPLIREHNRTANRGVGDMPSVEPSTLSERVAREVMTIRHEKWRSRSLADTQRAYEEAVTAYNDDESLGYVASFVPTFTMVALDDLLPYRNVKFEGLTLSAPAKPEVFLQMQYGDFMTEPMPHQQLGHGLLWWSDPEGDSSEFGLEPPKAAPPAHHESLLSRTTAKAPAVAGIAAGAATAVGLLVLRRSGRH